MEARPKKLVLDTNVIIRFLRGKEPERNILPRFENISSIATTIINVYELYYGAFKSKDPSKNLAATKGFVSTIDVLEFDDRSAERSGETMAKLESRGNMIDPRDLFSGCIALENGYAVLTRNRKHFERIPDLLVLEPSDLI
jgi:tRNA(fMet)-specific endonuclease VapC